MMVTPGPGLVCLVLGMALSDPERVSGQTPPVKMGSQATQRFQNAKLVAQKSQ